jgi:hypothetical protein
MLRAGIASCYTSVLVCCFLASTALAGAYSTSTGPQNSLELTVDHPVERSIAQGDTHTFTVRMEQN